MKKPEIMNNLSLAANRAGLKLKKYSPEILMVVGVVGTVTSAVMACRATLKVDDILSETQEGVEKIHNARALDGKPHPNKPDVIVNYTAEDEKHDLAITYVQTGLKLAKLYAPSVILGTLSITSIVTSHNIMRKRNAGLAAAYMTLDKSYKEYRKRVADRFGEEVEKEIRYNIKAKEITEEVVDPETGEMKTETKTVKVIDGKPGELSPYACVFDELNVNYNKDSDLNLNFLRIQQSVLSDRLHAKGHLFLNEVYDALGFPRTKAGAVVGWVYDKDHPNGDNFVDFGLWDENREKIHDFICGDERAVWLDFNVDGPILELIASHQNV